MSEVYRSEVRYQKGFDEPIASNGAQSRSVCRNYTRWVVDGRILEPGDPAEPKLEQVSNDRPRFFGVTAL